MIARGQNAEQSTCEKAILVPRLQFCMATLATGDWDRLLKVDAGVLPELLSLRITEMVRQGKLADVAQAVRQAPRAEAGDRCQPLQRRVCLWPVRGSRDQGHGEAQRARGEKIPGPRHRLPEGGHRGRLQGFRPHGKDADLGKPLHGLPEFESLFPEAGSEVTGLCRRERDHAREPASSVPMAARDPLPDGEGLFRRIRGTSSGVSRDRASLGAHVRRTNGCHITPVRHKI